MKMEVPVRAPGASCLLVDAVFQREVAILVGEVIQDDALGLPWTLLSVAQPSVNLRLDGFQLLGFQLLDGADNFLYVQVFFHCVCSHNYTTLNRAARASSRSHPTARN